MVFLSSIRVAQTLTKLVDSVFHNSRKKSADINWLTSHTILCATNSRLAAQDEKMAVQFSGSFS